MDEFENKPPEQSVQNVYTPEGELVGLPSDQVQDALASGYTMAPTPQAPTQSVDQQMAETLGEPLSEVAAADEKLDLLKSIQNSDRDPQEFKSALKLNNKPKVKELASKTAEEMGMAALDSSAIIDPVAQQIVKEEEKPVIKNLIVNEVSPAEEAVELPKDAPSVTPDQISKKGDEVVVLPNGEPIAVLKDGKVVAQGAKVGMFQGGMAGAANSHNQQAILKENYSASKKKKRKKGYAEGGEVELPSLEQIDQQYEGAMAQPSLVDQLRQSLSQPIVHKKDGAVNVLTPDNKLVALPESQVGDALMQGYQLATDADVLKTRYEEIYGSAGQQALAAGEGFAEGVFGPLATAAEEGLSRLGVPGISAAERRGRAMVNPNIRGAAELAGFVAPAIATMGGSVGLQSAAKLTQAGALATAEKALAKAAGLEAASGMMGRMAEGAAKGAFSAALYQGGQEISNLIDQQPDLGAQSVVTSIGLAGALGGVFGAGVGAVVGALSKKPQQVFVSELDRPAMEAGNFEALVKNSGNFTAKEKESLIAMLGKKKEDAPEIIAAAKEINAPVLEGMIGGPAIQKADDALINGGPTYAGVKRRQLYDEAYSVGSSAVDNALGEGSKLSKAELGASLKQSLSGRLKEENAPISKLFEVIKQKYEVIPVDPKAIKSVSAELSDLKELRLAPNTPQAMVIKRAVESIENIKTLDDIKTFTSEHASVAATASPAEKRMAAILREKLSSLEEETAIKFAKAMGVTTPEANEQIQILLSQRKQANSMYKAFIKDVQALSEQLGKGRVYGIQDALNFINERLTVEEVATKLFAKKDSEFMKFFGTKFPEEAKLIADYQKQLIREEASKTGKFQPILAINKINKLEPEIQKQLFDDLALKKLKAADKYLRSFPKNFNPSGTADRLALRQFFDSPTGAVTANVRDMALTAFIKTQALSPETAVASKLGEATVKGLEVSRKAAKNLFDPAKQVLPSNVISLAAHRNKLAKMLENTLANPAQLIEDSESNPVPEYAAGFSAVAMRAAQYLNSIKPKTDAPGMFDKPLEPSQAEKTAYERQLALVQQPLLAYGHIKNGTIIPQDVTTLRTVYPELYAKMSQDITNQLIERQAKGQTVPYRIRTAISLFLGIPLDYSLSPAGIISTQVPQQSQQQPASQPPSAAPLKTKKSSIAKLPENYETPLQSRAQRATKN